MSPRQAKPTGRGRVRKRMVRSHNHIMHKVLTGGDDQMSASTSTPATLSHTQDHPSPADNITRDRFASQHAEPAIGDHTSSGTPTVETATSAISSQQDAINLSRWRKRWRCLLRDLDTPRKNFIKTQKVPRESSLRGHLSAEFRDKVGHSHFETICQWLDLVEVIEESLVQLQSRDRDAGGEREVAQASDTAEKHRQLRGTQASTVVKVFKERRSMWPTVRTTICEILGLEEGQMDREMFDLVVQPPVHKTAGRGVHHR
ncbi:hypothetical protein LTR96_011550 [Exophiala xenobiotica]|nr:hypothetical protein LTR96_011550 [Exophiala xenobiotica]KAK5332327.1 hypothetical protein LTR98_011539 [Exophiala xenobiotica]